MSNNPKFDLNDPDALSAVLARLRLGAEVYSDGNFCGAWAVDTSGSRRIPFHLIGRGEAWLHVDGRPAQMLSTGDLVLFPCDAAHIISSTRELPAAERVNAEVAEDGGPFTHVICGFFEFENKAAWPLLDSLDSVIVLDLSEQSVSMPIRGLIDLIIGELNSRAPGFYAVIEHLAYLLFIQILRQQIQQNKVDSGLLEALFDPKISKALRAIHNSPAKSWSLESLGGIAAMGRSSFAARFNSLVGVPPMQYVTAWRMQQAKILLQTTSDSIVVIAEQCGYESEAAFRKAFKKNIGVPPGQLRGKKSRLISTS